MIDSMLLVRFILSFFFNKVCLVDRVERECFLDDIIFIVSYIKIVLEIIEKESNRSYGVGFDKLR